MTEQRPNEKMVDCDICGKPCPPVGMPVVCDACWDTLDTDANEPDPYEEVGESPFGLPGGGKSL